MLNGKNITKEVIVGATSAAVASQASQASTVVGTVIAGTATGVVVNKAIDVIDEHTGIVSDIGDVADDLIDVASDVVSVFKFW